MTELKQNIEFNNKVYFRPPWTCGRYNADKHVAIFFNLISKMNYFYEAESAEVIGYILEVERCGSISINDISVKSNISPKSIVKFFDELCTKGLLSNKKITENVLCRNKYNRNKSRPLAEELANDGVQSAYQAYTDAVNNTVVLSDVMFELTYRCQAQCVHCYNPGATRNDSECSGRDDIKELSIDDYKSIIDDLCNNGLVSATITGGDPFMHPNIWQIIDYLYQHNIAITIYTNGIGLVGKEEKLAMYYPYKVQCSLYSGDPFIHDKITRTKGSWKRTINVMDKLHELGVPIDIACPIMQTNLKTYWGVKPYMHKYGSQLAFDVMLTDSLDGDKCVSRHLRLTPEQLSVVLLDEDVIQHIQLDKSKEYSTPDRNFLNGSPCGVLKNSFCINPNGDLTPCCAFHKVLGNIKKQKIKEIIDENDFVNQWKQIKEVDYGECYSHEYCYYCYFCPGNNYNDREECLNGGENNCYLAKIRYDTAMRYRAGEDLLNGKTLSERIKEMDVTESSLSRET